MPDIPNWWDYPIESLNYLKINPIKLNNPNIFKYNGRNYDISKYNINGNTYNLTDFKNNMFELYLDEVDPYLYGDYDDSYAGFDPISYYLQLMLKKQDDNYNLTFQSIINSATPNGIGSILSSTAKPALKLPDITRNVAELQIADSSYVSEKIPISDSFDNSTFGKNYETWSTGLNLANSTFTGIFGEKNEYDGIKGDVARGLDSGYDTLLQSLSSFGPAGKAVSLVMLANKLGANIANKLGAGTDGMTGTDAFLGSSFMQLTPFGLINGIGGKKTNTIRKDDEIFANLGADYSGTNAGVDNALKFSGKKYGTFSNSARKDANALLSEMNRQLILAGEVADNATTRFNLVGGMSAIAGNRRGFDMQGGYDLRSIHAAKNGMKIIERTKDIISNLGGLLKEISLDDISSDYFEPIEKYKEGGKFNVIPEGALHARLHHMENADNLTKKGIPVVSESEDGKLEQQAEIERGEIILRLEVTKKLEELLKKYSNEEISQKEKDEVAIEAGKLLVLEILHNTIDNTNNLL